MEYKNLLIETEDHIILLTINRPRALNALNGEVMKELDHFFGEKLPALTEVKGVVVTGSGDRSFIAGADVTEFLGLSAAQGAEISKFGQSVFFKIEGSAVPVVAVINGFALGGGCELAMSCHLRIAETHAKFGQPEVNLGLIPGYGGTQRLLQYIGKSKAMEMLLTADMIDAEEALSLGLVNHMVSKGEGINKAKKLIEKIHTKGPLAIKKTIDAVNAYFKVKTDGFETEFKHFGEVIGSEDCQEGVNAFLEKRKASFKGK
jgi:enoyl-CoA hydratase